MRDLDCVTIILAGGRGKRLSVLTNEASKPVISFGGAYRLIDFTLSNCKYSRAKTIGILTQYRQKELADYISTGNEWFPTLNDARIVTLPPKNDSSGHGFYSGTADAIWKNIEFIESCKPENILVLSGDQIYKMDYAELLDTHRKAGASCTVAALNVNWNDASRFGVIKTDRYDRIIGFEEKPKNPKTNLVSMGAYVFNWEILKDHLFISNIDPTSIMDIGENIIPQMLMCGEKLVVHRFGGYWKDVGDIYSLWEANMELLSNVSGINLQDDSWRIISRNNRLTQYIGFKSLNNGYIKNSLVTDRGDINGRVVNSVISADVEIGDDASIFNSVVMPGAKIGVNTSINRAIIGSNAIIGDNMEIDGLKPDGVNIDSCCGISAVANNVSIFGGVNEGSRYSEPTRNKFCVV